MDLKALRCASGHEARLAMIPRFDEFAAEMFAQIDAQGIHTLVVDVRDNGLGTVIGERSTYRPTHYGDLLTWQLPNTGASGYLSHKIFFRPDTSRNGETCLEPDVLLDLNAVLFRGTAQDDGAGDSMSMADPFERSVLEILE